MGELDLLLFKEWSYEAIINLFFQSISDTSVHLLAVIWQVIEPPYAGHSPQEAGEREVQKKLKDLIQ
jgi:hypothetical protein